MTDWTFSRPLPPGAFPDEDHLAGSRHAAKKRDQKQGDRTKRTERLPSN
jgi:hypothetical protein